MPFSLDDFARTRPFVYHLTARENLEGIRSTRRLNSANASLVAAGATDRLRQRRPRHLPLRVDGHVVLLRDQRPLHGGSIRFEEGWSLEMLVEYLNHHVFFWPGTKVGPVEDGRRHCQWYQDESPFVLRAPFEAVLSVNRPQEPLFSHYNSGSPRCSPRSGRSPRGSSTFLPAGRFPRTPCEVVEVVYGTGVALPPETEMADGWAGPWRPLPSL